MNNKIDIEKVVTKFVGVACIYMPNQLSRILEIIHESLQDHAIELASIEEILLNIRNISCECLGEDDKSNSDTKRHSYPNQRYPLELKIACVELYLIGLATQKDIALDKGVSTKSVGRWVKQYKQYVLCEG